MIGAQVNVNAGQTLSVARDFPVQGDTFVRGT